MQGTVRFMNIDGLLAFPEANSEGANRLPSFLTTRNRRSKPVTNPERNMAYRAHPIPPTPLLYPKPPLPEAAGNYGTRLPLQPKTKKITHITRNRKNKNLAIPADAAAIPPNPRTAAISAMIRKATAQLNIVSPPRYKRIASTHNVGCKPLSNSCWLI